MLIIYIVLYNKIQLIFYDFSKKININYIILNKDQSDYNFTYIKWCINKFNLKYISDKKFWIFYYSNV